MDTIILPVKPYNDFWLSCKINNLLAILTCYDPSFSVFPLYLENTYELYIPNNKVLKPEEIEEFFREGKQMLHSAITDSDKIFEQYLDISSIQIDNNRTIHELILDHLQKGEYVFCTVDRYFLALRTIGWVLAS